MLSFLIIVFVPGGWIPLDGPAGDFPAAWLADLQPFCFYFQFFFQDKYTSNYSGRLFCASRTALACVYWITHVPFPFHLMKENPKCPNSIPIA